MSVSAPSSQVTLVMCCSAAARRARASMSGSGSTPATARTPGGDGQGQLAGAAAKINHDVVTGKPECAGEGVDHSRRVATPVLVVEVGHLATETQVHDSSLAGWRLAVGAVQRTA